MQVYLMLRDASDRFLIGKKREVNKYWKREVYQDARVVNQAGQYCFPGGRMDSSDPVGEAVREFTEETGWRFDLAKFRQGAKVHDLRSFKAVEAEVPNLEGIVFFVNKHLQPSIDNQDHPSARYMIRDWELAEVRLVRRSELTSYLGRRQPVSNGQQIRQEQQRRATSQSIDWYGQLANLLTRHS